MADIICQKCGYKTNNIEENIERGSTCPICRGELKTKGSKSCGCIILAVIIVYYCKNNASTFNHIIIG